MRLLKMCCKNREDEDALARKLRGAWVADGILATGLGANHETVPLHTVSEIQFGSRCVRGTGHLEWKRLDALVGYDGMWRDKIHTGMVAEVQLISTDKLPYGKQKLVCAPIAMGATTIRPAKGEFNLLNAPSEVALSPPEQSIISTILYRRASHFYLPQVMRRFRAAILAGKVLPDRMLKAAEQMGNRFLIAAIKLAQRGFKSKRFVPRPLLAGDEVRPYYDRYGVREATARKSDSTYKRWATVSTIGSHYITTTSGDTFNYRLDGTLNDVWPLKR